VIVTVVGLGKIGQLYRKVLRFAGIEVISVDPRGHADYRDLGQAMHRSVDVWVIACPTVSHLPTLARLLEIEPSARVLVEKPICEPSQVEELRRMLVRYPQASVLVSDAYSQSDAVARLRDQVADRPVGLSEISVDMSKNRVRDVDRGRFVDHELGEAGYEWIHMFRVASQVGGFDLGILPALLEKRANYRDRVLEIELTDWTLRLSSGLDGEIFGVRRPELYRGPNAEMVRAGSIPHSSEFRHRAIEVTFKDATVAGVLFEPFYEQVPDYKNVHLFYRLDEFGRVATEELRQNHFSDSSIAQIQRLHSGPAGLRSDLALMEIQILTQTASRLVTAEMREEVG
jgi:predicted dehydrogenase